MLTAPLPAMRPCPMPPGTSCSPWTWVEEGILTHGRDCHADAGHHDLENSVLGCGCGLTQAVPVLIRDRDSQLELSAGRGGMREAPGHAGGEIETQGRDTALGHISRRGWCPAIFPITACESKGSQLDPHSHLRGVLSRAGCAAGQGWGVHSWH